MARKTVTLENMNQNVKHMGDSISSPLLTRAAEIQKELAMGIDKPFCEIIRADVEDSHTIGQRPLTFLRQVLTVCEYPPWMSKDEFPPDIKQRAHTILEDCGGYSIGSYTYGVGIEVIRKHIAQFIERRDGIPTDYKNVILFSGASEAIRAVINVLNYPKNGKPPGLLIPIPKYPLYSSVLLEYGMHEIGYFLDEENNWEININEMQKLINEAKQYCHPRALVVINPGNPTGAVLSRKNMEEIIKFAHDEKLFIMADEVYQETVYSDKAEFLSFKKVATEMNCPYCNMEIASFMSASKGYMGECGLRGGYCEIVNVLPPVMEVLLKSVATRLCPSVMGQAAIDCVVNAPQPGEPSYELFIKEKNEVLLSLKKNAELILNSFNGTSGFTCTKISAATYAFPSVFLPEKVIKNALLSGISPDYYYAMELLENTGVCVIPGSVLGQKPGSFHIRIPLLLPLEKLKTAISSMLEFHRKLLEEIK